MEMCRTFEDFLSCPAEPYWFGTGFERPFVFLSVPDCQFEKPR